jgi:2-keto-4-pentenoate hydratase/2-oxohepta-3-ene-1,7-dioic acid hydratase in catechol pathway
MQWCRFQVGEKISYGIVENGQVTVVDGLPWEKHTVTATRYELARIKILLPVIPPTFYCVGINYRDHIIKSAQRKGVEPVFPKKPDIGYRANNALCAHEEPIIKPADSGEMFQYEGELVAVIGKQGKYLTSDQLTIADIYLYIVLSWHPYVGVDISSYPIIANFYETVKALPEVVAAHERIGTSPATAV